MIIKTSYPFIKPPPSARLIRGYRSAQGLIGCWLFNESSGSKVFDLSGNKYTGTITTPTWTASKFGYALDTTANGSHVDTGVDAPFDLPELTVLAWVLASTVDSGQLRDDIVNKEDSYAAPVGGWMLRFDETGDKFEMICRDGANWRIATGATARTANTWYQVVGRYSAASTDIIVNAKIDATTTGVAAYADSVFNVYIGENSDPDNSGRKWNGLISHVMIWNRFLSLSEITLLYQEPFCMFERKARIPLMSAYAIPPVGNAGIMTPNTGYWGPTY